MLEGIWTALLGDLQISRLDTMRHLAYYTRKQTSFLLVAQFFSVIARSFQWALHWIYDGALVP